MNPNKSKPNVIGDVYFSQAAAGWIVFHQILGFDFELCPWPLHTVRVSKHGGLCGSSSPVGAVIDTVLFNNWERYDEEAGPLSPLALSVAAGVSGSFTAATSHGFDTARSRPQCTVLPKD